MTWLLRLRDLASQILGVVLAGLLAIAAWQVGRRSGRAEGQKQGAAEAVRDAQDDALRAELETRRRIDDVETAPDVSAALQRLRQRAAARPDRP